MSHINLSWQVGGKNCTILCILFCNGYQVLTSALADLGANAFILINTKCAAKLADFLNASLEELPKPIPIYGYNGLVGQSITSILQIHLQVDGQKQYNVPFFITDFKNHNMILKRKWLAYLGLQFNVWNRQLIWPKIMPPTPSFIKEISIIMENFIWPQINTTH